MPYAPFVRLWWMLLVCACWWSQAGFAQTLTYQRHEALDDPQHRYMRAVLDLAIAHSGVAYQARPAAVAMVQSRAIDEIRRNTGVVDLIWTMTSLQRERELLPIRIPVDRGLIGWRLALVRADRQDLLRDVRQLQDLQAWTLGQMHDWPDTRILLASGLKVEQVVHYEGLFRMLSAGRIDLFPRSALEIQAELTAHAGMGLAIEPHVLIRYPAAFYFFVSRQRTDLARDLERGLDKAVREGQLQALFEQHLGPALKTLNLAQRRVIEVPNPLLPPGTPLTRAELWYRP